MSQLHHPRSGSLVLESLTLTLKNLDEDELFVQLIQEEVQNNVRSQIADAVLADDWEAAKNLKASIAPALAKVQEDLAYYGGFRQHIEIARQMWEYATGLRDSLDGTTNGDGFKVSGEAHKEVPASTASTTDNTETEAVPNCPDCGNPMQHVRPGKWQCECEYEKAKNAATQAAQNGQGDNSQGTREEKRTCNKRSSERAQADMAACLRAMMKHRDGRASTRAILDSMEHDDPDAWLSITSQSGGVGMYTTRNMLIRRGFVTGNEHFWVMTKAGAEYLKEYDKKGHGVIPA